MSKYRSYAITISPSIEVEGKIQKDLTAWINKQPYAFAVIEGGAGKEQKRHLHAQVFYEEPREKGSLTKALKRIVLANDAEAKTHIAVKVKIAYNDDFIDEYMTKDITELIRDEIPAEASEYYPSEEEQQKVKQRSNATDPTYHYWKELYEDYEDKKENPELADIARFMANMMFVEKKIKVISDKRHRVEKTKSLWMYINSLSRIDEFLTKDDYELWFQEMNNKII